MKAIEIAQAIRNGETTAVAIVQAALAAIEQRDTALNCFTTVTSQRALDEAAAIDAQVKSGARLPPLAGVPYAVKNLFDVAGLVTLAGSKIEAGKPAKMHDATVVRRMREAGAVLVGALNMDEYAYGFTTENAHYGVTRNPHDPARISGGSSGGSAAALAAGLVPLSLGTDTNGSIRVPASLCGVFGLKPTFGRLSRSGCFPFVDSLDHVGPFARCVADLAACYDALQGVGDTDPASEEGPPEPISGVLGRGLGGLRVARLGGYFDDNAMPEARAAALQVAEALNAAATLELPQVHLARAAAFVMTAAEGGVLHLDNLRRRAEDFDPLTRPRLIAGALTPASWYLRAVRFRAWFRARALELFERYDVLIAPTTPCSATPIGQEWLELSGRKLPLRASMGLLTQPISFIGLPVLAAPLHRPQGLPIGVQLIAAPWREDLCFRVAAELEREGVTGAPVASLSQ